MKLTIKSIFKILFIIAVISIIFGAIELLSSAYSIFYINSDIGLNLVEEFLSKFDIDTVENFNYSMICSIINSCCILFIGIISFIYLKKILKIEPYTRECKKILKKLFLFTLIGILVSFVGIEIVMLITKIDYSNSLLSLVVLCILYLIFIVINDDVKNRIEGDEDNEE